MDQLYFCTTQVTGWPIGMLKKISSESPTQNLQNDPRSVKLHLLDFLC